ncbi:UPF0547 protein C16orf87 homolog isoform X1 [Pieris brassicae]|uniref:UPF0547 domain-containing protein n=1 Tax=Pieris brassicae TaxID=7116 RepID=A0A9P0TQL0_PIEBR|nr:UPF0547 protein C16orf87 homolog isoform X1 [Pieris brassicae]CAH4033112.1 unnamed protein product [Pieris brassicae]
MGKNKMIAKSCPKCEMQVAVASKSCKCGHTFFASRRGADTLPPVDDIRRRTGRVKRAQPQFYDAQDYQKQKRKSPKKRSLDDDDYKKDKTESGESTARARRRRALRRATKRVPQQSERTRDPTPQLRPAQIARCQLILSEINRKMKAVTWQPPSD